MQMFGALQSATVVTLLLQDLMTGPFAVGIVLRSLFLLRKKKRRLEEIFEADIDNTFENKHIPNSRGGSCCISREEKLETLTATDSIIDALDVAEVELKRIAEHEDEKARGKVAEFQPNMIMLGLSPSDYVLRALSYISTNDLEQTLQKLFSAQALPFSDALKLLSYTKDWTSNPDKVELVCRIVKVLLQIHHSQLISTPSARPVLAVLKEIIYARVKECKDTLGFNLAAMDHLKQLMASRSDALFRDAKSKLLEIRSQQSKRLEARTETKTENRKKKKRKK